MQKALLHVSAPLLAAFLPGCRSLAPPALSAEPWEELQAGRFGVSARPGLFTDYDIDGDFFSTNLATGEPLKESDSGDLVGKFGAAMRLDFALSSRFVLAAGADYRRYDVENLNPIEGLEIEVDEVKSLQYYLALRYLLTPWGGVPRLRPFAQVALSYLPGVDIDFEVDLSAFGSSNLKIESEGDAYWVAGFSGGLAYQWSDHVFFELGLLYEIPLNDLDADLSFDILGSTVPLSAEFEPQGLIGFFGISYLF